MKKTLSFLLSVGVLGSMQAQNAAPVASQAAKTSQQTMQQDAAQPSATPTGTHKVGSKEPNLPFLGSSANYNGILDATTTAVSANQATGLITMTHRDNNSNLGTCGSGAYIAAYSTNGGTTWDTTVTIFCNEASRYPNGVIFNPAGNTTPTNAYDVVAGPYTGGTIDGTAWSATVYGSVTFGNTNLHQMYWQEDTKGVKNQNNGDLSFMSSSDDSTVHVIGEGWDKFTSAGYGQAWLGAVLTTGKFNAAVDSFNWTQTVFRPHLMDGYKGATTTSPYDSNAAPYAPPGTAWSQDGKTGYVVIFGNIDSVGAGYNYNFVTYQPIVYKTTNSGQTWSMLPLFNFRNLPSLTKYLVPTTDSATVKIPVWFNYIPGGSSQGGTDNYDLTVDYQGNLHIFGAILSAAYANPDSSYGINPTGSSAGYIYDVYTSTATGGWKARYIDSMHAFPVGNAGIFNDNSDWDSTGAATEAGFGNRLQVSRTTDGKHIFVTWEDDLTGTAQGYLAFPDVFGQAYDVATGTASPSTLRFTSTSNNYYLCASDIALTSGTAGDTTYTVPCTIIFPQQTPSDGTTPMNYFYLGKVQYNQSLQSVPNISAPEGFSISQNYPNPFNNTTQFAINLVNGNSAVSVDVFNLVGQKIYSIPTQQMSSGNHLMTINAAGWSTGVYFTELLWAANLKPKK